MITLHVEVPLASFRKSYARSLGETYPFAPPATVYGMLLSLVGERIRVRHQGVKLAFAYAHKPRVTTTLRSLSRYKYGIANKQAAYGNIPDYVESLCGIDFLCWVDSDLEQSRGKARTLEARLIKAISSPEIINRSGVLALGLSDDAVNEISLIERVEGFWHWLTPCNNGLIELPIWVDHVGSRSTRWQRYHFDTTPSTSVEKPNHDKFVTIFDPITRT